MGDIVTIEGPKQVYKGTVELVDVTVVKIEKSLIKVDSLSIKDGKMPIEGGLITAHLTCKGNGVGVHIEDGADWLSIASTTINTVTFRVQPNTGDARKATITFNTSDGTKDYTAETTISQEAFALPHGESPDDPFTVAEAVAKCKEIGSTASEKVYYAKGIISSIDEVSTKYGNASFNISDDGQDTNVIKVFRSLYDRFEGITWYVQAVLNKVWESGRGLSSVSQIDDAVHSLVEGSDMVFHDLFRSQNEASRALLRAVAADGCVPSPTSGDFLSRYGFKSHSTVRSALANLIDGDLLYQTDKGYVVYDRLFGIWLSQR